MLEPLESSAAPAERAKAQRARILNAAEQCFAERGFHAASMAAIAETARVSAGLIYRYFKSKSAIVLAITERQLAARRADIARLQAGDDLASRIAELFDAWRRRDSKAINAALFLEISAEGSRDAPIGQALAAADRISRAEFSEWLRREARASGHEPDAGDIRARAFALQCFIEGLAIRAAREPDADPATLTASMDLFLPRMLDFSRD